ncbi:MAG: sigma 54-interacting transcriptional regulator [Pseudomonadota bacterium]
MPKSIDLDSLVESHEHPFMVIDDNFTIVAVNRAFDNMHHTGSQPVVGRHCYEVSHGNDRPCYQLGEECPFYKVRNDRRPHSCVHVHRNDKGQDHQVRVTGFPLVGNDGTLYVGESIRELAGKNECAGTRPGMVGMSPAFLGTMERLSVAAVTDSPVLLLGETGTGKELAAGFLHAQSKRRDGPFLTLDCTVLTEPLFESEVFGHERGSFTGSHERKPGLFELAAGGTLFLDEMGDLPPIMQGKLLRVLESGEFRRVGGTQTRYADVRVICATNRDLLKAVRNGGFREDLYYRIACMTVHLPSLRQRREDIPLLANTLLERMSPCGRNRYKLAPNALQWLNAQPLTGNVRELRNLLYAAAATALGGTIRPSDLEQSAIAARGDGIDGRDKPATLRQQGEDAARAGPPPNGLRDLEARHIADTLSEHGGNRSAAATALGISVRTLYRKLKKYGLN